MNNVIFHSLGSNYSREFIERVQPYISHPMARHRSVEKELCERLANHFNGQVLLTYKGRDAIEIALRPLADQRSQHAVITQGLACHAIEEGIVRAGMIPVYADLEKGTLGPSLKTITEAYERAKQQGLEVTAIFLQHTLGYANPVPEISRFCEERGLVLIADLAQSFGAKDEQDIELGLRADVVICSFGRDKVIDAVSGGAVIFRSSFWEHASGDPQGWIEQLTPTQQPPKSSVFKEMLYPSLTRVIREQHSSGVGKVVFRCAKALGLLTSPIAVAIDAPTTLPSGYIAMALWQLDHLEEQLQHRRQIAEIYEQKLSAISGLNCLVRAERLNQDIHLRVPVLCESAEQLQKILAALKAQGIFLSDRWYRTVVDSGSLNYPTIYQAGQCPVAESVATRLLNLPTHIHVLPEDAERIAQIIVEHV